MPEHDLVMLYSGGADSFLMLHWALQLGRKPYCILIDYGQKHIEELDYAKKHLESFKVKYQIIKIEGYNVKSGLTTGDKKLYEGVHENNVPARNSIFLTIAAGIAENIGCNIIWIGCDMDDFYGQFPDCKQDYIGKINKVFEIAFSYPIKVEAPLLGISKNNVLEFIEKVFGTKKEDLYTGYREFA